MWRDVEELTIQYQLPPQLSVMTRAKERTSPAANMWFLTDGHRADEMHRGVPPVPTCELCHFVLSDNLRSILHHRLLFPLTLTDPYLVGA